MTIAVTPDWNRKVKTGNGNRYTAVFCPDHPRAWSTGYVYEHDLVMELSIGRFLLPDEVVHHRDGPSNDIGNLELKTRGRHTAEHSMERAAARIATACGYCGMVFDLPAWEFRDRIKLRPVIFCSRSCGTSAVWKRRR